MSEVCKAFEYLEVIRYLQDQSIPKIRCLVLKTISLPGGLQEIPSVLSYTPKVESKGDETKHGRTAKTSKPQSPTDSLTRRMSACNVEAKSTSEDAGVPAGGWHQCFLFQN